MTGRDDSLTRDLGAEALERGRLLFAGACDFIWGTAEADQLPEAELPEVAFAGRSNVGKSSLVNALTGRKTLARTSQTPGRTQQLNFFNLAARLILVDMPGYGYARESKEKVASWSELARDYLRGRPTLRRALVLVDSRHGLKPSDEDILSILDKSAVPCQVILTKVDKASGLKALIARTEEALKRHPAAFPQVHATSSQTGAGIPELRASLAALTEG
jgi:GTP-binding protein